MIRIIDDTLKRFIEYLEKEYPTKEEARVSVLWGYDACCDDDTGGSGFAVYVPPLRTIMISSDIPEVILKEQDEELKRDFVIHNFAHEYRHFLQDVNGEEFDEQQADDFADKTVKDFWEKYGKGNEIKKCPFCGGMPFIYYSGLKFELAEVVCKECWCQTKIQKAERAIEAWNRRVDDGRET